MKKADAARRTPTSRTRVAVSPALPTDPENA